MKCIQIPLLQSLLCTAGRCLFPALASAGMTQAINKLEWREPGWVGDSMQTVNCQCQSCERHDLQSARLIK